jgi:hypothetical protein
MISCSTVKTPQTWIKVWSNHFYQKHNKNSKFTSSVKQNPHAIMPSSMPLHKNPLTIHIALQITHQCKFPLIIPRNIYDATAGNNSFLHSSFIIVICTTHSHAVRLITIELCKAKQSKKERRQRMNEQRKNGVKTLKVKSHMTTN